MKLLLSVSFLIISATVFARTTPYESLKRAYPFRVFSSVVDSNMSVRQCSISIHFQFEGVVPDGQLVYMSINGLLENVKYKAGQKTVFDLTPGKYSFKVWGGPGYQEIITDSIEFKPQTINDIVADIILAETQIKVKKPVVYFHSDRERNFSLSVIPQNNFTFTYPNIENGWNGTIHTDGSLTVNNKNYPYLFWEAEQKYAFKPSTNGYHLKKNEYLAFLEKKCDELGFNPTERTDFITFWGMQMQNHDELFVQFIFDEDCNQFGALQFDDSPDALRRVYIMIAPWSSYFSPFLKDIPFETIPEVGYSVLEWGGYEFDIEENTFTANTK